MKTFTVTNNETGVVKGGSVDVATDIIYFDAIQEYINHNAEELDNDEVKALMGVVDLGFYTDFKSFINQIILPINVGRYTVSVFTN